MKTKLPPGPRGRILPTLKLLRKPRTYYPYIIKKYGDPLFINGLNGRVVCTANPELIRTIVAADPMIYDPFATQTLIPLIGENSLLVISGVEHQRERKLLMPPFHGDRMRAYANLIEKVTHKHLQKIPRDKVLPIHDVTAEISMEIIVRAVFGVESDEKVNTFVAAIQKYVDVGHPFLIFSKMLHRPFFGIGPWDRFVKARDIFYDMLMKEIDNRLQNEEPQEDILSLLVSARYEDGSRMSREALRDHALTLLFAGHETTAVAMAWAFYHLHKNPQKLNTLHEELQSHNETELTSLVKLPYLKAVCDESLRLNPIVSDFLRTLAKPFSIGGYDLEPGYSLAVLVNATHYDENIYPQPDEFQPERFIDKKYRPWEYMPFGGGHRRCIGAAFALFEMAIVLKTALTNRKWQLCEPKPVKAIRRNVTMAPKGGIRMMRLS
ncbi:cytochrome P450 [Candidatus Uabimicrobium sp. HlEnr_7]|uniref:cytochrome P450 n=1 Tax=Candidatus Uabimicrobium helgolandensis TaxID=3095367 RepID=UPI003556E6D0